MRKLFYTVIPVLFAITLSFAPTSERIITGQVMDDKGKEVSFATITETGTTNRVKANEKGKFSIKIKDGSTITVSAIGYESKTITPASNSVSVTLTLKDETMKEVVVTTALGVKKRPKELGYAQATISNSQLFGSTSSGYAGSAGYLQGSVPGVTITNSNGQASQPRIILRGASTVTANNSMSKKEKKAYKNLMDTTINDLNREGYDRLIENPFLKTTDNPLSTFSIDVDAAAYSNVRRFINSGQLPPNGAIRTEEMINYFKYQYPQPTGEHPFSINTELSVCPWNQNNKLLLVGLQGKNVAIHNLPPSNLVFLIDVSGSMQGPDRLGLVQSSLKLLVDNLREEDLVSMVVYAGNAGLVLPATSGKDKLTIKNAIEKLNAGGSTAGGDGIKLAYKIARQNFMKQQNNRVILCTDGDFNVGISSDDELERLIEKERESGIYLTVLGFGMGNYQDAKMQKLADKGNGNHAYIDQLDEAKKLLVKEFGGTLFTIAKDVKLQLEFNPAKVQGYRLIGYENRMLAKEDFNDDKKDAGELGSGHSVTALYEIIPAGIESPFLKKTDDLKYQRSEVTASTGGNEITTIKFRYKEPEQDKSKLLVHPVADDTKSFAATTENLRFAAGVAGFAMLLRKSEFRGRVDYTQVMDIIKNASAKDDEGYKKELLGLVTKAKEIDKSKETAKLDKKSE